MLAILLSALHMVISESYYSYIIEIDDRYLPLIFTIYYQFTVENGLVGQGGDQKQLRIQSSEVFFGKNCYCVFISGGRRRKSFLEGEVQQGSCSWNRLDLANTGL